MTNTDITQTEANYANIELLEPLDTVPSNPDSIATNYINKMLDSLEYKASPELRKDLGRHYLASFKAGRNLPFTKELIAMLPVGFTPTSLLPSFGAPSQSKYFRARVWPLNLLGANKINLDTKG